MKHWIFRNLGWLSVIISLLTGVVAFILSSWVILPVGLSIAFFLHQQALAESKFTCELFSEFNARYSRLNHQLNTIIIESPDALSLEQAAVIDDYFNLCAEEYYFHRRGYLERAVWKSWISGMRPIFAVPAVFRHWESQPAASSFYGFNPLKEGITTMGSIGQGS